MSSPSPVAGATRCRSDELKPLDEEEKRLYQRIVPCLGHASGETSWATRCLAGVPLSRPYPDADWASDKTSRRSTSGGVVTLGGGVLDCWAKKQKSVALSSRESGRFAATTSGTRSLGIQSELVDLGYKCSVTVATDSQSVVARSTAVTALRQSTSV